MSNAGKICNIINDNKGTRENTGSLEDISEYTDADESISAPTEILAEFLSSIMMKDYERALNYCKLILRYEPNNSTAKEFYPLITEKIEIMRKEQYESDEDGSGDSDSDDSTSSNHSSSSNEESESKMTDSEATSASYSSLEDEVADAITSMHDDNDNGIVPPSSKDIVNGNANIDNEIKNTGEVLNQDVGGKTEKWTEIQRQRDGRRRNTIDDNTNTHCEISIDSIVNIKKNNHSSNIPGEKPLNNGGISGNVDNFQIHISKLKIPANRRK